MSNWAISERALVRWQCLVAYMKALDLLHPSMRAVVARGIVPPHRDGHQNGHQESGYISHCCCCFVCYCPGGCRSDTEQVVARWWRPVASSAALDMLHLGNAACTASTPLHGHRNGQRQRCILSLPPPPPFSLGVIIAKDHVMVH